MKVALCLYGLVGSKVDKNGEGSQLDPAIAFQLNKKNIIDINNADIFIHSWSYQAKKELENLYQPKASIVEPQVNFPNSGMLLKNIDTKQKVKELFLQFFHKDKYIKIIENRKKEAFRACSRWYSSKQVLTLKSDYEKKNDFKYDAVIILRIDVGFYTPLNLIDYDLTKFYASHWNDYPTKENGFQLNFENHNLGLGFLDFWFFSNSQNMDEFSELYDFIDHYHISPHRSSYQHAKKCSFDIGYTLYRWQDHEMIRRKEFEAGK